MIKTLKEKKLFFVNASKLLEDWQSVYHDGRSYADHCVNVKRQSDYFNIDEMLKTIKAGQFADAIKKDITEEGEEIKQYYYDNFLESLWDQLSYELTDIEAITEGAKDQHKTFMHIKDNGARKAWPSDSNALIWSDGRSGGWCCFNSHGQDMADELEYFLNNNYTSSGDIADSFDIDALEDAENYYISLSECLEEVNYIIDYIKRFNNGNKFIDYMQDQAEQILYTLQEEEAARLKDESAKINNLERASLELKTSIDSINEYINKYIDKEPEKTKITRQIKALKSVIKNAA